MIKTDIMENNEESKIEVSSTGALTVVTERKPTSLETDELKGPVKQVKQTKYKAFKKFGIVYLGEQDGNAYNNSNFISTYREDGSKSVEIKFSKDGSTNQILYNEIGLIVELNNTYAGGVIGSHSIISYDKDGKQLEHKMYDAENILFARHEYLYDDKGKQLFNNQYGQNEVLSASTSYLYDENGKNIESKTVDASGNANYWTSRKYNSKGHLVESQDFAPDGSIKQVFKYYENYDKDDNPIPPDPTIKHTPYVNKESLYVAKTELDHRGNWIKKINYFGELPISIYLREFTYFEEEEKKILLVEDPFFQLPFTLSNPETNPLTVRELTTIDMENEEKEFSIENAKWLVERSGTADNFSALAYYALKFNEFPSQTVHASQDIDAIALMGELKSNLDAIVVNTSKMTYTNHNDRLMRYTLSFPEYPGYLVHAMQIQQLDEEGYEVPEFIAAYNENMGVVNVSQILLLHPSESSKLKDKYGFENDLLESFEKCSLERIPDKPEIYMVEVNSKGEFSLQSHAVREDFEIEDLDVQYGYGFEHFHNNLMGRFKNESQGLVLFHGIPGTGKTYYIRHLLKEMSEANKIVIYMPPNMVDYLVDPGFMTFLSGTVTHYSENGNFCVLLIEDAEPLLAARHTETRIQGVTNLLNMTDGLLNDMLKLQIICTFNVELKHLDAALLRPGRLIARKEFKPLQELDANLLAQRLGIKYHFTKPTTLSEIYAKLKNKNTLIHDEY